MTTVNKIYCTNDACKGRDSCAKAVQMKDGDTPVYFVNAYYANRCKDYKCNHPEWRQFANFGFQECHACHERKPYPIH